MLTILGAHVLPAPGLRVPMTAFVAMLAEFGVGEQAARATVQRSVTNVGLAAADTLFHQTLAG